MKRVILYVFFVVTIILGGDTMSIAQQPPILQAPPPGPQTATPPSPPPPPPPPGGAPPPPPNPAVPPPQSPPTSSYLNYAEAPKAVETARLAKKYLTFGKVWINRAPAGEVVIKAAILYQQTVVATIEFDPTTGEVLPCGYHPKVFNSSISITSIKQRLPDIISSLEVLNGAEFREPESCWIVPLSYKGMIVSHLKVYYDGIHIVPDYPAMQESRLGE